MLSQYHTGSVTTTVAYQHTLTQALVVKTDTSLPYVPAMYVCMYVRSNPGGVLNVKELKCGSRLQQGLG